MNYIEDYGLKAQEHFNELLMFVEKSENSDLNSMEKGIFERLLKIGKELLQLYFAKLGTGILGGKIQTEDNNLVPLHSIKKYSIISLFGEIQFSRAYYFLLNKLGIFPLDSKINLPDRCYSYLLQRFCMGRLVKEAYNEVSKFIKETFGIEIPSSSIQKIAFIGSQYFENFYKEKPTETSNSDDLTIVSADGKGVPMRKKKEDEQEKKKRLGKGEKNTKKKMSLVGTVFNTKPNFDEKNRHFEAKNKKTWAFLAEKMKTMELISSDLQNRIQEITHSVIIFIADGQKELWKLKEEFFPNAIEILDWFHMTEYLWKAVYVFYPEGSDESKKWIKKMEQKMLNGKVTDVIKGLRVRISKNNIKGHKLKILNTVISYFENNKQRMKYNEYRSNGYPIGSGCIEGACRYLIKDRLEMTGMRWTESGAQSVISLRSLYINGDFDHYWDYFMNREQQRLYQKYQKAA